MYVYIEVWVALAFKPETQTLMPPLHPHHPDRDRDKQFLFHFLLLTPGVEDVPIQTFQLSVWYV